MASPASQQALEYMSFLQDPEHKNWQKAGLCFYIVKEVLEPCVEDVSKTIYEELTSLSKSCPCLRRELCGNCREKWIEKLKGYAASRYDTDWENKDIFKKPGEHWSVAKCFVEHDQKDKKDKDSASACDISPILTFIVNCNKFQDFGRIQANAVKVRRDRNKYIHDAGQPKVSNTNLMSFKMNMVNLLKNDKLKATGKAEAAQKLIEKVCDVNYIISLEDEVKAKFSVLEGKLDLINTDIKPQLQSLNHDVCDLRRELGELDKIKANQSDLDKQNEMYQDLKQKIDQLEVQQSSLHKTVGDLVAKDEMSQEEEPRKKRPEMDDLKQLKNQTEDKINTLGKLTCIPTKQAEEAKKLLEGKRSIVIKGNPGEGKTTTAIQLIDIERYRDRRVLLYGPQDWKAVDTDWVDIVVLEDVFGQFDLDPGRLQDWMVYLPNIQEHVDAGKLQVIVTTRVDILSKAYSKLGSIQLFSNDLSLKLSSEQLTNSEKMLILNRELHRRKKWMTEDDKDKCISNFTGLIGFPQCCSLFSGDSKLFDRGPEFFGSPKKFFAANITMLKATRFLPLAFLFCNGEICEENLSPETMPETSKHLLMELASHLDISEKDASIRLLRIAYDSFLELYVEQSKSYNLKSGVGKPCIWFTHATVCEAVGQVLGEHCVEMVVKYGNSEFVYQRTYTAKAKDNTAENVFIPVSMYGLLAERMVHDVIKRRHVGSIVKHSALKQQEFLMKLKCKLNKGNEIKDFFTADRDFVLKSDLSEGECRTFMQYILQSDEDVVRIVYDELLEFLACEHNNNTSDCWKCEEKQKLLELALYYQHFQIANKLISMKACYTYLSLCNAARHGDLGRVQTIMKTLKRYWVFNPGCEKAKDALCRAYISGNQSLIEFLLKEGIILDSRHVLNAVQHGDIDVLMKVVEHLKCHNKWNPHTIDDVFYNENIYFEALLTTYHNEKFDMADYLLKKEVNASIDTLAYVSKNSSQQAVARVIQNLKDTGNWDPKCDTASQVLVSAYKHEKYDVCDLLVKEGVSLTMKNFPVVVCCSYISFEILKKAIQNLKDTGNWDPKCDDASQALENAYQENKCDVCDLLVQEGVSLKMKNFCNVVYWYFVSLDFVKKLIQHLKDTDNWDPMCDDASKALENACQENSYDLCHLLVQEGVSLTVKNFHVVKYIVSVEILKKVIQNLKDTENWDPLCDDASEALENAYKENKYDVCDLLVQEGVSPTMKTLPGVTGEFQVSLDSVKKAIQHLKDTDKWDPKCNDASQALENAYKGKKYDVFDLLVEEGVSLPMKNLPAVVLHVSLETFKKVIQNLKDTDNWDPKCDDASKALENAYGRHKYYVFGLLAQNEFSLPIKNHPDVTSGFGVSLETSKKAIQNFKDTDNWNLNQALSFCDHVHYYDVCDLLVQEGVSLTMKNLPGVIKGYGVLLETVQKAIQHLKDNDNWDPKCGDASQALENAYKGKKYDVFDLLVKEGVSLKMKDLPAVVLHVSLETFTKVIQNLKDTDNWDPKCDDAAKALENAYEKSKYDVCDLLVHEGVSLPMKNDLGVTKGFRVSLETVKKAIQHLKNTDNWNPKCDDASKALENAYQVDKYDVCDLLVQEGVSLTMKNLPGVTMGCRVSLETVKKAIQHLKNTDNWNPKCDDASKALENAYQVDEYDVWLPKCDDASKALENAYQVDEYDVWLPKCDDASKALENAYQVDEYEVWLPKCDDVSEALENAYQVDKYDVCDLLVQEGVSLTMKNLPGITMGFRVSLETVKKVIQHLKNTDNWNPKCDDASKALESACQVDKYDVCDLLVQEGVSLAMQ